MIIVSDDKWRDAVKFLVGMGTNPTLTAADQKTLQEGLRGPFKNGMTVTDAQRFLRVGMRWAREYEMRSRQDVDLPACRPMGQS